MVKCKKMLYFCSHICNKFPLGIYMKCIPGKPDATQMLDKFSVASFRLFFIVRVRYVQDIIKLSLRSQKISIYIQGHQGILRNCKVKRIFSGIYIFFQGSSNVAFNRYIAPNHRKPPTNPTSAYV